MGFISEVSRSLQDPFLTLWGNRKRFLSNFGPHFKGGGGKRFLLNLTLLSTVLNSQCTGLPISTIFGCFTAVSHCLISVPLLLRALFGEKRRERGFFGIQTTTAPEKASRTPMKEGRVNGLLTLKVHLLFVQYSIGVKYSPCVVLPNCCNVDEYSIFEYTSVKRMY